MTRCCPVAAATSRTRRRGDRTGSPCNVDNHACGGRAGHHLVVSDQRIRYPADRIRVRRLRGAATPDDAGVEDRLALPRRRGVHRRRQPKLRPTKPHRDLGDGDVAPGLADHSDLRRLPGTLHPPVERDQVHRDHRRDPGDRRCGGRGAAGQALGMLPGTRSTATWSTTPPAMRPAAQRCWTYVSAWTKELHRLGYLAGMYANLSSGARHLSEAYASTAYARLDALWIARWGCPALTGWAIPNTQWANHQRGKQYRGDHDETYGGVRINIDSDRFDAPVATVGYAYQITSSTDLNGRSGPKTTTPIVKTYAPGATVTVVCQTPGTKVGTTRCGTS